MHARIWGGNADGGCQENSGLDVKLLGYAGMGTVHNAKTWAAENPTS